MMPKNEKLNSRLNYFFIDTEKECYFVCHIAKKKVSLWKTQWVCVTGRDQFLVLLEDLTCDKKAVQKMFKTKENNVP